MHTYTDLCTAHTQNYGFTTCSVFTSQTVTDEIIDTHNEEKKRGEFNTHRDNKTETEKE